MRSMKDLYAVLGVSISASAREIRTAYRRLAVSLHPDRAGRDSTAAFQDVAAAYEVLSEPARRARYDAGLDRPQAARAPRPSSGAQRTIIPRVSGPLRSLIATGALRRVDDETFEVVLTFEEAEQGGFIAISTPAPNQLSHWISVPAGARAGDKLTSVVRVGDVRSVLQLRVVLM
jgi:DnaJ-class molecular chaperone